MTLTPTCPAPKRVRFKTPPRVAARARALVDQLRAELPARNEDDAARGNPLDAPPEVRITYRGLVDAFEAGLAGVAEPHSDFRNGELPPEGALRRIRDLFAELPPPSDFGERVRVDAARWLFAYSVTAPRWDPVQAAFWAGLALSADGAVVGVCGRPLRPGQRICHSCAGGVALGDAGDAPTAVFARSPR